MAFQDPFQPPTSAPTTPGAVPRHEHDTVFDAAHHVDDLFRVAGDPTLPPAEPDGVNVWLPWAGLGVAVLAAAALFVPYGWVVAVLAIAVNGYILVATTPPITKTPAYAGAAISLAAVAVYLVTPGLAGPATPTTPEPLPIPDNVPLDAGVSALTAVADTVTAPVNTPVGAMTFLTTLNADPAWQRSATAVDEWAPTDSGLCLTLMTASASGVYELTAGTGQPATLTLQPDATTCTSPAETPAQVATP